MGRYIYSWTTAAIVLVPNNANAVSFTGYDQNFKPLTGTTIFVNPTSVPEPSSMLGKLLIGGSILALKRNQTLDRSTKKSIWQQPQG